MIMKTGRGTSSSLRSTSSGTITNPISKVAVTLKANKIIGFGNNGFVPGEIP